MAIITISRLTGSGGREIAAAVSEVTGFEFIDRKAMDIVLDQEFPVPSAEFSRIKKDRKVYDEMVRSAIADLCSRRNLVILGSGAQFLLAKVAATLHVLVVAPLPLRIARIMRLAHLNRDEAEKLIESRDQAKRDFIHDLYEGKLSDPANYDIVLNMDHFSTEVAVEIIVKAAKAKGIETQQVKLPANLRAEILTTKLDVAQLASSGSSAEIQANNDRDLPEFAHSSERAFAQVMDFYRIRWEYEPRTFPIEWDEERNVIAAFAPDFYLPDLDLFIELTTMKQSLVTKKNRKVRRLRELYPDINIKVLYERDYRNLIWKYGLSENGKGPE